MYVENLTIRDTIERLLDLRAPELCSQVGPAGLLVCTESRGHTSQHAASTGDKIVAIWDDDRSTDGGASDAGTAPEGRVVTCDVCGDEPAVAVVAMPGVPMSVAYGEECIAANAHPYDMVVVNTAMIDGMEHAADWWKEIVSNTLTHLGKSRVDFEVAVAVEIEVQHRRESEREQSERAAP